MRTTITLISCLSALLLIGCANSKTSQSSVYQGSGGMTHRAIQADAYLYHYEHGFSGIDALGYNEQLQTVWSRLGAANTCQIAYDQPQMIQRLMQAFGETAITHELNGIGFHSVQSRKVPRFCDKWRTKEISAALRRYNRGEFK